MKSLQKLILVFFMKRYKQLLQSKFKGWGQIIALQ